MLTTFLASKATVLLLQQEHRAKLKTGQKLFWIARDKLKTPLNFDHRKRKLKDHSKGLLQC